MAQVDQTPVDASVYAKSTVGAIEQSAPLYDDADVQARARRIRRLSTGDRLYAQAALQSRISTYERNIKNGYVEYRAALAADKRVLELSQTGIME